MAEPYQSPPSLGASTGKGLNLGEVLDAIKQSDFPSAEGVTSVDSPSVRQAQSDAVKIMAFIRANMTHGHLQADLDPLELSKVFPDTDLATKEFLHPTEKMK